MGSNISRRRRKSSGSSRTLSGHLRKLRYVNKVINNEYYYEFVDHMKLMMKMSLDPELINDPVGHLDVQKAVYVALEQSEPLITKGRKLAAESNDKSLLVQAHRNKLIAVGYREIADGLAWRTLGYDRARLRILAEANTPGFISSPDGPKVGRAAEFRYAHNVMDNGAFVLMHDVTNQFLVGDLSMVRKFGDIPHLAEIKTNKLITPSTISKKLDKSMKLSAQEDRLFQAHLLMEKDQIGNYDSPASVRRIRETVSTFHNDVRQCLKDARENGLGHAQPASYIDIEVIDFRKKEIDVSTITLREKPFSDDTETLFFSNYDYIAMKMDSLVMRGKAPYTIYPYLPEDRIDLMTGGLYLHVALSITQLKRELATKGWKLEVNIPDDRKPYEDIRYGGNELFRGSSEHDLVVTLSNIETGFVAKVGMEMFTRIGAEFMTIEDLLIPYISKMKHDVALPANKRKSSFIFPVNEEENKIWD